MKKTFVRIIDDQEISIDTFQDFIDDNGVRHPRNVLWLWNDEELWDVLHIRVDWVDNTPLPVMAPHQIALPVQPPSPVAEPEAPLPPAPPAPPPEEPHPQQDTIFITGPKNVDKMIAKVEEMGVEVDDEIIAKLEDFVHSDASISQMVAYGGIAFRTLRIKDKGGYHQGHRHNYDHMTNLIRGSVLCEVDGAKPKAYHAPCQITIAADHWHKFTALEDNVVYQCVYRQDEREDLYTVENSPYNQAPFTSEELVAKLKTVDNPCAHCDCDKECDD